MKKRADRILETLRDLAGPGAQVRQKIYEWHRDNQPESATVYVPTKGEERNDLNLVGQPPMRAVFVVGFQYWNGEDGERCLVGLTFKEVNEDVMELLLGLREKS